MLLKDALDDFLLACKADSLSENTVTWYAAMLKPFIEQFGQCAVDSIQARDVRQYIVDLQQKKSRYVDAAQKPEQAGGLSEASIESHKRALRRFWSFCHLECGIDRNPMAGIKSRQPKHMRPKAVKKEHIRKLWDATTDDAAGARDRALLALLLDTGVRMGGLLGLDVDHIDWQMRKAVVTEKGRKQRNVAFSHFTGQLIRQWLKLRETDSDAVFTSLTTGERLSQSGIDQILKRLKRRAGVTGRVNAHSFRHRFAVEYLTSGGDLMSLARQIGHTSFTTTYAFYAIFAQDELADLHEKHSPLKKLMKDWEVE